MTTETIERPSDVVGSRKPRLTQAQLREVRKQEKKEELLSKLVEQITMLEAKKRKGKSMAAVAIAYNMREIFGMPTVVVGSPLGLNNYYGPYVEIDEYDFMGELERITAITKHVPEKELREAMDEVLKAMGVNIYGACVVFDESYKLFDARTPHDKIVKTMGQWVAQSAHYHSTAILTAPHRSMIDKRIRLQVDWFGRCSFLKARKTAVIRFKQGLVDKFKLTVPAESYGHMYDSWVLLGYRSKDTDVGGL